MSRNKDYQRLLNAKRWKELRAWKLRTQPTCEMCEREGKVSAAIDCHHIIPVESASSPAEMERLAYNPSNLMSLCIPCHIRIHKEMGKSKKENHAERVNQSLQRWIARHTT